MYIVKICNLKKVYSDNGTAEAFSYDQLIVSFKTSEASAICSFNFDLLNYSRTTSKHYSNAINEFCRKKGLLNSNILYFYKLIKAINKADPLYAKKLKSIIGGNNLSALIGGNNGRYGSYKKDGILYVSYNV